MSFGFLRPQALRSKIKASTFALLSYFALLCIRNRCVRSCPGLARFGSEQPWAAHRFDLLSPIVHTIVIFEAIQLAKHAAACKLQFAAI